MMNPTDLQTRYDDLQRHQAWVNEEGWWVAAPTVRRFRVSVSVMLLALARRLAPAPESPRPYTV